VKRRAGAEHHEQKAFDLFLDWGIGTRLSAIAQAKEPGPGEGEQRQKMVNKAESN